METLQRHEVLPPTGAGIALPIAALALFMGLKHRVYNPKSKPHESVTPQ